MVEPGQVVTQVLKAEFGEEAMAKLSVTDAEREKISRQIDRLFHNGVEVTRLIYLPFSMKKDTLQAVAITIIFAIFQVYKGYVDDPRNTDNAWMETVAVNFHDDTGEIFSEFKLQVSCFCIGTPGRCEGRSEERLHKPLLICKPTTIFWGEKFSFSYTYYHTLIVLIHERSLTGRCSGNELASIPLPPPPPSPQSLNETPFLTF